MTHVGTITDEQVDAAWAAWHSALQSSNADDRDPMRAALDAGFEVRAVPTPTSKERTLEKHRKWLAGENAKHPAGTFDDDPKRAVPTPTTEPNEDAIYLALQQAWAHVDTPDEAMIKLGFGYEGGAVPTPTDTQIEDRIEWWHHATTDVNAPVSSVWMALGWTEAEYGAWVQDPTAVPHRPLPDIRSLGVPTPTDTHYVWTDVDGIARTSPYRPTPDYEKEIIERATPTDTRERIEALRRFACDGYGVSEYAGGAWLMRDDVLAALGVGGDDQQEAKS